MASSYTSMSSSRNQLLLGSAALLDATFSCNNDNLDRKLLAIEEALSKLSPPRKKFLLDSEPGVFIWNGAASGLACACFLYVLAKTFEYFRHFRRLRHASEEVSEILARREVRGVTEADVARQSEEETSRERITVVLAGNVSAERLTSLSIDRTIPTAENEIHNDNNDNSINMAVHMAGRTLSPQEVDIFSREAASGFVPGAAESGSTFWRTKLSLAAFTADDLLRCAVGCCDVGENFDSKCTVQLGNAALFYKENGSIKGMLLKKSPYCIPIITSAKKYGERIIVIKGSYLGDTEIKATTRKYGESFPLQVLYHEKLDARMEVLLVQLIDDLKHLSDGLFVHARKTIRPPGSSQNLVLRSYSEKIDFSEQSRSEKIYFSNKLRSENIDFSKLLQSGFLQSTGMSRRARDGIYAMALFLCFAMVLWLLEIVSAERSFLLSVSCLSIFLLEYIIGPWTYTLIKHCLVLTIQLQHVGFKRMGDFLDIKSLVTRSIEEEREEKTPGGEQTPIEEEREEKTVGDEQTPIEEEREEKTAGDEQTPLEEEREEKTAGDEQTPRDTSLQHRYNRTYLGQPCASSDYSIFLARAGGEVHGELYEEFVTALYDGLTEEGFTVSLRNKTSEFSAARTLDVATSCKLGVVVLCKEYFSSLQAMLDLQALLDAEVAILPLFCFISVSELVDFNNRRKWHPAWDLHGLDWRKCDVLLRDLCDPYRWSMPVGLPLIRHAREGEADEVQGMCNYVRMFVHRWILNHRYEHYPFIRKSLEIPDSEELVLR